MPEVNGGFEVDHGCLMLPANLQSMLSLSSLNIAVYYITNRCLKMRRLHFNYRVDVESKHQSDMRHLAIDVG